MSQAERGLLAGMGLVRASRWETGAAREGAVDTLRCLPVFTLPSALGRTALLSSQTQTGRQGTGVKSLFQGHTVATCQSWGLNPGQLAPRLTSFTAQCVCPLRVAAAITNTKSQHWVLMGPSPGHLSLSLWGPEV